MSCGKDAKKCTSTAQGQGAPEAMAVWAEGRGAGGHCPDCGGFLTTEGVCNNPHTFSLSTREQESINEGASLAGFLKDSGLDPLNNEAVRRLHQNYVSISTGVEREVVMDPENTSTAATDLRGKVYLNPYPLGENGAVIDQLLITQMYIDHELGHELFTPLDLLKTTIAISGNQSAFSPRGRDAAQWRKIWKNADDLSPEERELLHNMVNVVEDARMERVIEQQEPYMWKQMLAGQLIQPKDDHARNGGMRNLPDHEQVLWATQIVGQSNYTLTDDIQAGMSDEAIRAIRDLMPMIDKGVRGNAFDTMEASIAIVREIKRRGMLDKGAELTRTNPDGFSGSKSADGKKTGDDKGGSSGGDKGGSGDDKGGSSGGDKGGSGDDKGGSSGGDKGGSGDDKGGSSGGDKSGSSGGDKSGSSGGDKGGSSGGDKSGSSGGDKGGSSGGDKGGSSGGDKGGSSGGDKTEKCSECGAFLDKDGHCNKCGGHGLDKGDSGDGKGGSGDGKGGSGDDKGGSSDAGKGGGTRENTKGLGAPEGDNLDAPLSSKTEQDRLEKNRAEAREKLKEMRDLMTGQYQKAVKKLISNAEKHLAKKLAEAVGKHPKSITLPLLDDKGNMVSRQYKTYSYEPLLRNKSYQLGLVDKNREVISRGAARLAGRLKKMKQEVLRDAYLQKKGSLDRRRMTSILKGSDRVRMRQASRHDTSMAVTMSFDISGSMTHYSEQLGTIAGIIGRGLEKASVPYEFRAYSADQYQVKAFEHKRISDGQVGSLYNALGQNCDAPSLTMGGYALQTREEAAKIQFVLTDGQPQSFNNGSYGDKGMSEVKNIVEANRAKGVLTMGIFFAGPSDETKEDVTPTFDFMYGQGNWMYVPELDDVPGVVTGTLEKQLAKFLPNW